MGGGFLSGNIFSFLQRKGKLSPFCNVRFGTAQTSPCKKRLETAQFDTSRRPFSHRPVGFIAAILFSPYICRVEGVKGHISIWEYCNPSLTKKKRKCHFPRNQTNTNLIRTPQNQVLKTQSKRGMGMAMLSGSWFISILIHRKQWLRFLRINTDV